MFINREADDTWGAIMVSTPSNPTEHLNVGGCMLAAGVSAACARAAHVYPRCASAACDGCDLADNDACVYSPQICVAGGPSAAPPSSARPFACAASRRPADVLAPRGVGRFGGGVGLRGTFGYGRGTRRRRE